MQRQSERWSRAQSFCPLRQKRTTGDGKPCNLNAAAGQTDARPLPLHHKDSWAVAFPKVTPIVSDN